MDIKVTIGLNAETQDLLGRLLASLAPISNTNGKVKNISEAKSTVAKAADTEIVKTQTPVITLEEVRKLFTEKGSAENKPKLRKLLDKFGAKSVSNVPEENYLEFRNELIAI